MSTAAQTAPSADRGGEGQAERPGSPVSPTPGAGRACFSCSPANPGFLTRFDAYLGRAVWVPCLDCNPKGIA